MYNSNTLALLLYILDAANEDWLALFKRDGGKVERTDSVGVNFRIIKFLF